MSTVSDLLQGTGAVVQNNATTYLVQQYARLQAVPLRMQQVVRGCNAVVAARPALAETLTPIQTDALGVANDAGQVIVTATQLMQSVGPQMQTGQVPPAFTLNIALVAQLANVALQTENVLTRADNVDSNLRDVVQQLQATGNLSNDEAAQLLRQASPTASTVTPMWWYVVGGIAVVWLLTRKR